MADDPTNDDPTPDNDTPDPSAGGGDADPPPFTQNDEGHWVDAEGNRVYTAEDYNKGMKAARRDGEQRARTKLAPKAPDKPKTKKAPTKASEPEPDAPAPVSRAEFERMQLENRFHRLDAVKKLSDKQATRILKLAQAEGVESADLADYVEGAIEDLGISVNPPPSDPKKPNGKGDTVDDKTTPEPGPPKVSGAPGKVNALDVSENGMVDVFSLTPEQADRMGADKIAEHYERALVAADEAAGRPPLPRAYRNHLAKTG